LLVTHPTHSENFIEIVDNFSSYLADRQIHQRNTFLTEVNNQSVYYIYIFIHHNGSGK